MSATSNPLIFVFGSNLAGIHGAGAAKDAVRFYGAVYGIGIGLQGNSYGIPTKDENLKTLPLERIKVYVDDFLRFAKDNPKLIFNITRIGCGLAGYKDADIGPLFINSSENCLVPYQWEKLWKKEE